MEEGPTARVAAGGRARKTKERRCRTPRLGTCPPGVSWSTRCLGRLLEVGSDRYPGSGPCSTLPKELDELGLVVRLLRMASRLVPARTGTPGPPLVHHDDIGELHPGAVRRVHQGSSRPLPSDSPGPAGLTGRLKSPGESRRRSYHRDHGIQAGELREGGPPSILEGEGGGPGRGLRDPVDSTRGNRTPPPAPTCFTSHQQVVPEGAADAAVGHPPPAAPLCGTGAASPPRNQGGVDFHLRHVVDR